MHEVRIKKVSVISWRFTKLASAGIRNNYYVRHLMGADSINSTDTQLI